MSMLGKRMLSLFSMAAVSIFCAVSINNYAFAAQNTFTDDRGVEWVYEEKEITTAREVVSANYCDGVEVTNTPALVIGFKAAPTDATTVVLPSFTEVVNKIGDQSLLDYDTYYVDNLLDDPTTATLPSNLTKIDMSSAAKAQIRSLMPLTKNRTNEIELVFGNDVVIADVQTVTPSSCRASYTYEKGAFEGLKLKITNLAKVKYIGWRAFRGTTLAESNREIVISDSQTVGGRVFESSNVASLNLNAKEIGEGFCRDCTMLTGVTFGDNVEKIYAHAFRGASQLAQELDTNNIKHIDQFAFEGSGITGIEFKNQLEEIRAMAFGNTRLGSLDFTGVSPRVGVAAFYNAHLDGIELGDLSAIDTGAFAKNNITDLTLPKAIHNVGAAIFAGNPLETVTVQYDMLMLRDFNDYSWSFSTPFRIMLTGVSSTVSASLDDGQVSIYFTQTTTNPFRTLTTLNIEAPYGENDTVPENRPVIEEGVSYGDDILASAKNIIPAYYFEDFGPYLETINIGEGYEFIGRQAFGAPYITMGYGSGDGGAITLKNGRGMAPKVVSLPSTLRGIGNNAFLWALNDKSLTYENLPTNIEYIGNQAFLFNTSLTIKNLNLPKLKYVGQSAFVGVKIQNLTINDSIERILPSAFVMNYDLKNITIDTDIFGSKNGTKILADRFGSIFIGNMMVGGWIYSPDTRSGGSYKDDNRGEKYRFHLESITFTNKSVTTPPRDQGMIRFYVDTFDASATKWSKLPGQIFWASKIKEIKLPSTITEVEDLAFMRAEVEQPVVLPEGVTKIGDRAFWGDIVSDDNNWQADYPAVVPEKIRVPIESLPSTVEEIGDYAFYKQKGFTADVTMTNTKKIGTQAFAYSNIRDLVLPNTMTSIGGDVALGASQLRNVTIDMNIHDASLQAGSVHPIFVYGFGDNAHKLGKLTFTENAGQPYAGFASYGDGYESSCYDYTVCGKKYAYFYGIQAAEIDLSATDWTVIAPSMFQNAKIDKITLPNNLQEIRADAFFQAQMGDIFFPNTLKAIKDEGFQWATANVSTLPEGLETIGRSAFYGSDLTDELVIPSTVNEIGSDAFNAGDVDVHYNKITLKPALSFDETNDQLIHQIFWNNDVDEMIIESSDLPSLHAGMMEFNRDHQEFWHMPFSKVTITSLPGIPANAFEGCSKLTQVDARSDKNLRAIGDEAFLDASKLHSIRFASQLKDEVVKIGSRAFAGTAFETMGDSSKDFDLSAAKFDATRGYAFSAMPKLRSVDIPRSFSGATIPVATFYNDTELTEATLDYKITLMDNAAFSNDNKLERIFIWGNTVVKDNNLANYTAPIASAPVARLASIRLASVPANSGDNVDESEYGPTIPERTDIYAYSVAPTEAYAGSESRDDFSGTFYPLDEVIYITSNKPRVLLNDEGDDFDKSDLIVYGMRRDGVIVESDEWGEFDGTLYPRSQSNLTFERMDGVMAANPAFGTIWDTPVPLDELDYGNVDFTTIDFELLRDESDSDVRLVNIVYTDKYTKGVPDTDIDPYALGDEAEEETSAGEGDQEEKTDNLKESPFTADQIASYLAIFAVSIAGLTIFLARRKK